MLGASIRLVIQKNAGSNGEQRSCKDKLLRAMLLGQWNETKAPRYQCEGTLYAFCSDMTQGLVPKWQRRCNDIQHAYSESGKCSQFS